MGSNLVRTFKLVMLIGGPQPLFYPSMTYPIFLPPEKVALAYIAYRPKAHWTKPMAKHQAWIVGRELSAIAQALINKEYADVVVGHLRDEKHYTADIDFKDWNESYSTEYKLFSSMFDVEVERIKNHCVWRYDVQEVKQTMSNVFETLLPKFSLKKAIKRESFIWTRFERELLLPYLVESSQNPFRQQTYASAGKGKAAFSKAIQTRVRAAGFDLDPVKLDKLCVDHVQAAFSASLKQAS